LNHVPLNTVDVAVGCLDTRPGYAEDADARTDILPQLTDGGVITDRSQPFDDEILIDRNLGAPELAERVGQGIIHVSVHPRVALDSHHCSRCLAPCSRTMRAKSSSVVGIPLPASISSNSPESSSRTVSRRRAFSRSSENAARATSSTLSKFPAWTCSSAKRSISGVSFSDCDMVLMS